MQENKALMTDLYQITMSAAYYSDGVADDPSTFDLFIRKVPQSRNYLVVAGIEEALRFLSTFHFTGKEIKYLKRLPQLSSQPEAFFNKLQSIRFNCDVWAMKEGTPVFGNEPIMIIQGPVIQAQLVETYLENVVGSRTMFASKASRAMNVIAPQIAVEFGTRRSHDPHAAIGNARSAYIAGFSGTSNVEAGMRYGIPVFGTMAHSYVMKYGDELEAFRKYAKAFPKDAKMLVDTYNTEVGIQHAITVGKEMEARGERLSGVRLDSGKLAALSKLVRKRLNNAGLDYVPIILSSDLNENKIARLKKDGVECQIYCVGTAQATSDDKPNVNIVYKLSKSKEESRIKTAEGKNTLPGFKQVFRYTDAESKKFSWDEICLATERRLDAQPLLEKVMEHGKIIARIPKIDDIRKYAAEQRDLLPPELRSLKKATYNVEISHELLQLQAVLAERITESNKPVNNHVVLRSA